MQSHETKFHSGYVCVFPESNIWYVRDTCKEFRYFIVCRECLYNTTIPFLQQKRARKGKNWTQLEVCQKKSRGKHVTEILQKTTNSFISVCSHVQQILGYARKMVGGGWSFSPDAVKILEEFKEKFPKMFEYLVGNTGEDSYYEQDLFPDPEG